MALALIMACSEKIGALMLELALDPVTRPAVKIVTCHLGTKIRSSLLIWIV